MPIPRIVAINIFVHAKDENGNSVSYDKQQMVKFSDAVQFLKDMELIFGQPETQPQTDEPTRE